MDHARDRWARLQDHPLRDGLISAILLDRWQAFPQAYDHVRKEMLTADLTTPTVNPLGCSGGSVYGDDGILTNCPIPAAGTIAFRAEVLPGNTWGTGGASGYPVGNSSSGSDDFGIRVRGDYDRAYLYLNGGTVLQYRDAHLESLTAGKFVIFTWGPDDPKGYGDYLEPESATDPTGQGGYLGSNTFRLLTASSTGNQLTGAILREFYAWDRVMVPADLVDLIDLADPLFRAAPEIIAVTVGGGPPPPARRIILV